tara:strand:+ start:216 stop:368 length:153 start_codon:yes stop_codon:yes gene_type:complete
MYLDMGVVRARFTIYELEREWHREVTGVKLWDYAPIITGTADTALPYTLE